MFKCATLLFFLSFNLLFSQQTGSVSWYGNQHEGRKTASGQIFRSAKLTAASNTHKLGTVLKITNPKNNKSVVVTVNDRGGFTKYGRLLDLSKAAFASIADIKQGIITVMVEVVN